MNYENLLKKTHITFVRHGTTEYNEQGRVQGTSDIPLSEKGLEDIHKLKFKNMDYDIYAHSPLLRSKHTLFGILVNHDKLLNEQCIFETELITERGYGIFEGLTKEEISIQYPELSKIWSINENVKGEYIETIEQVIRRIENFLMKIISFEYKKILAVTHSGFLYALYKYVNDLPLELKPHEMDIKFPNCCIVDLELSIYLNYLEIKLIVDNKVFIKIINH
jgi:broad specificity phosphatase PhoE